MKIVCDNCQAKYSIADEKVAGKVFKIRCKRCGNTIVVRGDEEGHAAGDAGGAAGEAIWHVVVSGEQHGPYEPAQLAEMLSAGTIDWEAYVWCEGFENWAPLRDVEDLVAQITGQAQPAQPVRASAVSYSAPPSMGADPFADDAQSGSSPFDAPAAADAGPDLFGPGAQTASGRFDLHSSPGAAMSAPSPGGDQQMTGARNENSVLFSLKNLQALATGSSPSNPPPAAAASAPGFATGEGSGLIDIRKLATATGVGEGDGAGEKDDLLSIGQQAGAFGALGSPMLATVADEDTSRRTIVWAGVAATAFLSVAAVAIVYILRPQPAPPSEAVVSVPSPTTPVGAPGNPQPAPAAAPGATAAPAAAPTEGELAAQKAAAESTPTAPASASDAAKRKRASGTGGGAKSVAREDEDPLAAEPEKPAAPKGPRTLDDLLAGALEGKSAPKPAAASTAGPALPENPSREDVLRAMNGVKSGVQSCAQGQSGVAIVNVTVAGATGRVTSAQVEGITGPAGSCIAREVRKASFPKFKNATFKVKYPYRL